jgi:limonene-1,2-epoxide hydrolase
VVALAVSAKKHDLETDVLTPFAVVVEIVHPLVEALPLRLGSTRIKFVVCGIFPVYQAKVVLGLW